MSVLVVFIYIMPIMWFNMPAPMVKWLDEVLVYKKTFVITKEYGEGGQIPADNFMIVISLLCKKIQYLSQ